jgi:hypothetical protein
MAKRRFSNCLGSDEITTHGYRVLTFAKCTTIMIIELTVKTVWDPLEIRWFWEWYSFGWFWCRLCGTV